MIGPEQAAREATLDAVHSDQMGLQEQLRDLSNLMTRIEEHLLGGPQVQMLGAAAAQAKATLGPGQVMPTPTLDAPTARGLLPQMCDLGVSNAHAVTEMQGRLANVSRLLSLPNA